ncbi:MAG TPA: hypothetical protein VNS61_06845 [Caldimonas sp.]|nr:hypothetical protein [Caldimonas sp.]
MKAMWRPAAGAALLVGALCGCAAPEAPLPGKALIGIASIEAAIRDESALNSRADCVAVASTPWFAVAPGEGSIVVTAPHATRPFREGAYRFADGGGTGALARGLNRLAGATAIYTVYASPSDPNYYDDNEFKQTLERVLVQHRPAFLLDIHASHPNRPYDVDLGTMGGASLLGQTRLLADLVEALRNEGIGNLSLDYFSAREQQTVTKFAAARGVPAIQLEINATWLNPSHGGLAAHRFSQLLQALVRFVEKRSPGSLKTPVDAAGLSAAEAACAIRLAPARNAPPVPTGARSEE